MEDLASQVRALKRELKEWEHGFEDAYGRKPTKDDIVAASEEEDGDPKESLVYKFKLYAKLKAQLELLSNPQLSSPGRRRDDAQPDSSETAKGSPDRRSPAKFSPPAHLVPKGIVTGRSPITAEPMPVPQPQRAPARPAESEYSDSGSEGEDDDDDLESEAGSRLPPQARAYLGDDSRRYQQAAYQQPPQSYAWPAGYPQQPYGYPVQQAPRGPQGQMLSPAFAYGVANAATSTPGLAHQDSYQRQQGLSVGTGAARPTTPGYQQQQGYPVPGSPNRVFAQAPDPSAVVPVVQGPYGLPWMPHPVMGGGFGVRGFGDGLFKRLPPNTILRCTIHRRHTGLFSDLSATYYLHNESDSDSFMLAARRRKKTKGVSYIIGTDPVMLKRGAAAGYGAAGGYVAKLRANPQRTMFVLYDARSYDPIRADKGLKERMLVEYVCEDWSRTALPREMHVGIPSVSLPDPEERSSAPDIITDYRMHDQNRLSFLRNKPPRWNSGTQSHCLNFGGRVTVASIKNFQLVMENAVGGAPGEQTASAEDLASRPVMQFGRTGPDSFCMDVTYPLSVAEAFSLALSTFSAYDAS